MKYEDEIRELRDENDIINKEITEKISHWVSAAIGLGSLKKTCILPEEEWGLDEEVYIQIRRLSVKHSLGSESVKHVFREIIRLYSEAMKGMPKKQTLYEKISKPISKRLDK